MGGRELSPGTVIHGRYRIEKMLGGGGFGVTYRVTDLKEGSIAAMKEYMPMDMACRLPGGQEVRPLSGSAAQQYEKFRQKFLDEARTIYKFRGHPNIVEVRHLFSENNTAYYVMEYVDGMDLGRFLEKQGGRMSWAMLRPIVAQVVSALKLVHSGGMIHCDISPDNIYLMNRGQVKLLDFGTARNMLRGSMEASVIVAKAGYSPWEQLRGRNMAAWTDVYALAATIYRCITGKMPPQAQDRMIQDDTVWFGQMGIPVPSQNWENALKKAMAVRAEDRYPSVTEFWEALKSSEDLSTSDAMPPSTPAVPMDRDIPMLECVYGIFAGRTMPIRQETCLGTDPSKCSIAFPRGTPGVSRMHLRFWPEEDRIMAMDMGSTYGTWLEGKKMIPGLAYCLMPGQQICLGDGQVFRRAESGCTREKTDVISY